MPDEPLLSKLQDLKSYVAGNYESKRAFRSPPHITLVPPFRAGVQELLAIEITLKSVGLQYFPFEVELSGFDFFSKGVVFVDVVINSDLNGLYDDLRSELAEGITQKMRQEFHPHMTLGLSDMGRKNFSKAKLEFEKRSFVGAFEARQFQIFKHDGKQWQLLNN